MSAATVLLVEDDPLVRSAIRELLEGAGHHVVAARNGVEAHALAEIHPPHAIVLDLLMPVAGGGELVGRLRNQGQGEIPVILYSGSEDLEAHAARLGAARCLRKPCPPTRLLDAVSDVLFDLPSAGGA
jgi:two-component system, OmpR family, alkaline phosphatase synthesis response regulator PhoP